jgi:hypothetical protein
MAPDLESKKLLADFYLRMRDEQTRSAQHHETQRATVTTIYASLAVADLALIGAIWQENGATLGLLGLALGLVVVGYVGFRIVVKLFERAMSHFSLAEAYLDSLRVLLSDEAAAHLGNRLHEIKYVANATAELDAGELDEGMFDIGFPGGKRGEDIVTPEMLRAELTRHNPIEPRPIVVPRHNRAVVLPDKPDVLQENYARVNLRKEWERVYLSFMFLGAGLCIVIAIAWAVKVF